MFRQRDDAPAPHGATSQVLSPYPYLRGLDVVRRDDGADSVATTRELANGPDVAGVKDQVRWRA